MVDLTERELDVLKLVTLGLTNKEIAKELTVTTHTIKAHVSSIYEKLSVNNRLQAAVYALIHELVVIQN